MYDVHVLSSRRRRALRRLILFVVAVVVVTIVLLKVNGKVNAEISNTAVVLAALLAAYPVLLPSSDDSDSENAKINRDSAVRQFSRRIISHESNQKARLLDFAAKPAYPCLVAAKEFYSYHEDFQPENCEWQDTFKSFWRSTPKRWVILGSAGAGKSLLLLDLVAQSAELLGADGPVLVRVNISLWRKSQTFYDFFIHQVSIERGVPAEIVSTLLAEQRIVPLLDGLDELDAEQSEKPERGLEILRRLNAATSEEYPIDAPIILTCRTSYFERLEYFQRHESHRVVGLAGAGILRIKSLDADQISTFLNNNLRAEAKVRWSAVLHALNVLQPPPIVDVLGLPWRLMLAFSAYQNGGSPGRLLAEEGMVAEAELLPQFLQMATRDKNPGVRAGDGTPRLQRQWLGPVARDPSKVARWLKEIAEYLERDRTVGGGAGVLVMYEVFKMVNPKFMRLAYGICALAILATAGIATFVTALSGPHPFPRIVAISVAAIFLMTAAYVVVFRPPSTPAGFTLKEAVQTPQGILDLTLSLLSALAASAFALGTPNTFLYRVIGGLCAGFMAGLFFGFVQSKRLRARGAGLLGSETPDDPMRGGLFNSSIIGGLVGSIYAVALLAGGAGPVKSILFGVLALVAFAPILGLPIASIAWTRYRLALFILYLEHRLPWRLNAFLVWSYNAGLMRTAGLAYQFRHLRMQTWLAETDEADLLSPLGTTAAGSGEVLSSIDGTENF
jgi:hypothetical protein